MVKRAYNGPRPEHHVDVAVRGVAAFLHAEGAIAGFARVDIIDGPDGTRIRVTE